MDVYRNNGIQVIESASIPRRKIGHLPRNSTSRFPYGATPPGPLLAYGAAEDASAAYAGRVGVVLDETGSVVHHYPSASARTFALDVLRDLGLDGEIQ